MSHFFTALLSRLLVAAHCPCSALNQLCGHYRHSRRFSFFLSFSLSCFSFPNSRSESLTRPHVQFSNRQKREPQTLSLTLSTSLSRARASFSRSLSLTQPHIAMKRTSAVSSSLRMRARPSLFKFYRPGGARGRVFARSASWPVDHSAVKYKTSHYSVFFIVLLSNTGEFYSGLC